MVITMKNSPDIDLNFAKNECERGWLNNADSGDKDPVPA
jgi:hypothetical protein